MLADIKYRCSLVGTEKLISVTALNLTENINVEARPPFGGFFIEENNHE